jgi:archaemetzincin
VREISLWWIGAEAADGRLLASVRLAVEETLDVPVRLWQARERPTDAFDARRQQHSSARILRWLVEQRPEHAAKVLAITDVDLFIPILTFVYGEAQLGGLAALVSMARLGADGGRNRGLLATRLAKESVHELGHTFGLIHCAEAQCVMSRSVTILNVDAKGLSFCGNCWAKYREYEDKGNPHHD